MTRCLLCLALLVGLLPAGCDSLGDCNHLGGSVKLSYDLAFTRVEIKKQTHNGEFVAMIVEYINEPKSGSRQSPVKVIANAPVTAGEPRQLPADGSITRVMADNSLFPATYTGKITFDELGEPGGDASGSIYVNFESADLQVALDGKFCGTVREISN